MAASTVQNPPAQTESKSAKKKKAKAERTESPAPAASAPSKAASVTANDKEDDLSENQYIRELQKNIRNVNKKITNSAKIENVIAENLGKSLDDLVSLKLINADQKSSHLKKPALHAQLAQLEEQLAQHKKIDAENRARITKHEKILTEKFEKEKADLVSELNKKADAQASDKLNESLLILSQFLRLAAARRVEPTDSGSDENLALEGVLLHIYSGDENAVATMLKLVQGVDEPTRSTADEVLNTTFAQVKELSVAQASGIVAESTVEATDSEVVESKEPEAAVDPTVVNASLTEIEEGSAAALTNGHSQEAPSTSVPSNADVADSAANLAGESQWDTGNDLAMSQEWVDVKVPNKEPSEPEAAAVPAPTPAPANTQSWADDHPEPAAAPTDSQDGFQNVQGRRGNRDGGYRGRGGDRGGYRGRGGFRGDGRGRGRGGPRGGNANRGPRRGGEEQTQ
ncbi:hypothetical protein B0H63DRAFT_509325 [Podospora didyma]|uniref:YAG7-like dimerisation domain-containing protein n=1 Tax=Podospora didyma TaxID=330526 RepID=A0AAE0NU33_9PEZI|nr:hypothetical protein B0H63DRAFT_509325 [Podospora didyma]